MKCHSCDVRLRADNTSDRWSDTCQSCAKELPALTVTDGDLTVESKADVRYGGSTQLPQGERRYGGGRK